MVPQLFCSQGEQELGWARQDTTQEKPFQPQTKRAQRLGSSSSQPRPGEGGEKKRNKELLVLKEIPAGGGGALASLCAGGSLNKNCWSSSSPVGKRMPPRSLGEKTELFEASCFLINPFCLSKKANKCHLRGLVAHNESFFSSGKECSCVQCWLCSFPVVPGLHLSLDFPQSGAKISC